MSIVLLLVVSAFDAAAICDKNNSNDDMNDTNNDNNNSNSNVNSNSCFSNCNNIIIVCLRRGRARLGVLFGAVEPAREEVQSRPCWTTLIISISISISSLVV